tara:strand:- start:31034 stop:31897 length:864 start_codon:yes stop_codon:yes gene_type:complete
MNSSNIKDINESEFEKAVLEDSSNKLIIVDFWAPWCEPCKKLTPTMEKVANDNADSFNLVKINIDENQQIAAQLRIQSIPAVFAFKDKQVVNAFQGVISENDFINFIEKSSGTKLKEDHTAFYEEIKIYISENKVEDAMDAILTFLSENTNDPVAISLYLECLLIKNSFNEFEEFLSSLDKNIKDNIEITKKIKKYEIIKGRKNQKPVEKLLKNLSENPNDVKTLLEISEYYFSHNDYDSAFSYLLDNYKLDKEKIKKKLVQFFEALGNEHAATKNYRKKFSSILFS